jgi:hypothetical protein
MTPVLNVTAMSNRNVTPPRKSRMALQCHGGPRMRSGASKAMRTGSRRATYVRVRNAIHTAQNAANRLSGRSTQRLPHSRCRGLLAFA